MKSGVDLVWTDGSVVNYKNWGSGLPNNAEHLCVRMEKANSYKWNDMSCTALFSYICQIGKLNSNFQRIIRNASNDPGRVCIDDDKSVTPIKDTVGRTGCDLPRAYLTANISLNIYDRGTHNIPENSQCLYLFSNIRHHCVVQ